MAKIGDAIAATLGDVSGIDTAPIQYIPLDELKPNPRNFYPSPDCDALLELASSIIANGLLEPLVVTPGAGGVGYRIISGHSRWRALSLPHVRTERPDLVSAVPCVILPPMSEERELCAVIEANRQRVKNAATLAAEAEKLTEAYVKRKEAGEKLPGRIRDRVAAALKVSESKLAMAQATAKNLTLPGFKAQWESGKIPDTVAYEISKMGGDHQYRLLDYLCNNGIEASELKVADVRALEEQFSKRPREWDMSKEKEDELFLDAVGALLAKRLRANISQCKSRADAIGALKKSNKHMSARSLCYDVDCRADGVSVRNGKDAPRITRSWTEVYDALCIYAMRKLMEGLK